MASISSRLSSASSSALRSCRRPASNSIRPLTGRRKLHERRDLPYPMENGVGDFLPPRALETVVDWQDGLLQRLNEETKGTPQARKSVLQIIIETAGVKEKILTYDYACLAANNSFFLDNLKPPTRNGPLTTADLPSTIKGIVKQQYSDVSYLTDELVSSAKGMMSSGWLWLVTDGNNSLAVLPTFGSGTLLVRSRDRLKGLDIPIAAREEIRVSSKSSPSSQVTPAPEASSASSPVSGITSTPPNLNPHTQTRSYSTGILSHAAQYSKNGVKEYRRTQYTLGQDVFPLACISLHEHAWISAGLGVWGKEAYVSRWLSALDWEKVAMTYEKFQSNTSPL